MLLILLMRPLHPIPKLKGKHAIIGGVLCLAKRKEKKMSIDYHILVYRTTKEEKLYLF